MPFQTHYAYSHCPDCKGAVLVITRRKGLRGQLRRRCKSWFVLDKL
jgi:uncharacterized protein YbaR (Trm112 family)